MSKEEYRVWIFCSNNKKMALTALFKFLEFSQVGSTFFLFNGESFFLTFVFKYYNHFLLIYIVIIGCLHSSSCTIVIVQFFKISSYFVVLLFFIQFLFTIDSYTFSFSHSGTKLLIFAAIGRVNLVFLFLAHVTRVLSVCLLIVWFYSSWVRTKNRLFALSTLTHTFWKQLQANIWRPIGHLHTNTHKYTHTQTNNCVPASVCALLMPLFCLLEVSALLSCSAFLAIW